MNMYFSKYFLPDAYTYMLLQVIQALVIWSTVYIDDLSINCHFLERGGPN